MAKFTSQEFQPQILRLLKSGYQVIAVECYRSDHLRAVQRIVAACSEYTVREGGRLPVIKWNPANGFERIEGSELDLVIPRGQLTERERQYRDELRSIFPPTKGTAALPVPITHPLEALELIGIRDVDAPIKSNVTTALPIDCAVIMKWTTKLLNDHPIAGGILADFSVQNNFNSYDHIRPLFIIIQEGETLSPILSSHVHVLQLQPPTKEDLRGIFNDYLQTVNAARVEQNKPRIELGEETTHQLVAAMQGLAYKDAEDCLSYSFHVSGKTFNEGTVRIIQDYKNDLMRSTASIKPVPWSEIPEERDVAGMDLLIPWLRNRARAFEPWAAKYQIDRTRAILLAGVPGCGKTLIAKIMSRIFGMPLYHLDWGSMKSKYVGESDKALRQTLTSIEAMHHGVFFIDEIEKALSGSKSAGGDSGLQRSMFGHFNQWLTEHRANAIIVAACNSLEELPPELIRRFDEIWGVGLPSNEEKWAIIQIRCRQKGIDSSYLEDSREEILAAMENFTGADVIKAFNESHFLSLDNPENGSVLVRGRPSVDQLVLGAKSIKSLFQSDNASVMAQMAMIEAKARPASSRSRQEVSTTRTKSRRGGQID